MKMPIYLDYAATTPVDPRVAAKMAQYLTNEGCFGNPASTHFYGQAAKQAIDLAREQTADMLQAEPSEIIWTSCATESINLALKGALALYHRKGKHIITLKTEHKAVLETCQALEKQGYSVTYLALDQSGRLDLNAFMAALRPDTVLVSVMWVNNETGLAHDIAAIAQITSAKGVLFHVDAVQALGKVDINVNQVPVDLMSISAHKIYGPKGIGALYVRRKPRVRLAPLIHGGGQEQGMRSGTLPVHQIVGMGEALRIAKLEMMADRKHIEVLRERFWDGIKSIPGVAINGDPANSVPHILNVRFAGQQAEAMMNAMPELAISTGSACFAKGVEPSYVLRALGLSKEEAQGALRFSFGRFTTLDEIDRAVALINAVVVK